MKCLNLLLLTGIFLFVGVFSSHLSFAEDVEDTHECGRNSLSDVICDANNSYDAVSGTSALTFGTSGGGIFSEGSPFYSIFSFDVSETVLSFMENRMQVLLAELPPALQPVAKEMVMSLIQQRDVSISDLTKLAATIVATQEVFDLEFEDIPCVSGRYAESYQQYAQNLYVQKISTIDTSDFVGTAFDILDLIEIAADAKDEICAMAEEAEQQAEDSGVPMDPMPGSPSAPTELPPGSVLAPETVTDGTGDWSLATSEFILRKNYANKYQCAKGVRLILEDIGLPLNRCEGVNGQDYHGNMSCSNGWQNRADLTPDTAPPGCLISYNSRISVGRPVTKPGSGHVYGHVEIVATNAAGKRFYVSDKPRTNWGGSVPENWNKQGDSASEVGIWCCSGSVCRPRPS